jgi:hypothetical protein
MFMLVSDRFGVVVVDQRLGELPVQASDFEAVRLELVAAGPLLAQSLSLCDEAPNRRLQTGDRLWGPGFGAPRCCDSLSGQARR